MAPSAAELSLRHLPDISDASFQIPVDLSTASGEFLLGNDNDDFLKAADDSLLTPAPLKRHYEPLTLAELTPKPKTRKDAPATVKETRTPDIRDEYSQTVKKPSVLTTTRSPGKPKLAIATQFFVPGSPVSQRLEDLKVGVEDLVNGSPENGKENITDDHRTDHASSRDNVKGKEKNRSKQTVAGGGISKPAKTKPKLPTSCLTRAAASRESTAGSVDSSAEAIIRAARSETVPETNISENAPDTMQPELFQTLLSAGRAYASAEMSEASIAPATRSAADAFSVDPFRLSELSPRKAGDSSGGPGVSEAPARTQPARQPHRAPKARKEAAGTSKPASHPVDVQATHHAAAARHPRAVRNKAYKPVVPSTSTDKSLAEPTQFSVPSDSTVASSSRRDLDADNTISEGVAATLMIFGQSMMPAAENADFEHPPRSHDAVAPSQYEISAAPPATQSAAVHAPTPPSNAKALQAEQEEPAPPPANTARPVSPMRASKKRSSNNLDAEALDEPRELKARRVAGSDSARGHPKPRAASALEPSLPANSAAAGTRASSSSREARAKPRLASHRARDAGGRGEGSKGKAREDANAPRARPELARRRPIPQDRARVVTAPPSASTRTTTSSHLEKPNAVLPRASPAGGQDVGFNFRLEHRMERARKAEDAPEDAKRSTKPPASVPDARTKHAAPHFAAAARKGGAAPAAVVPQPFLFTTEIRAREREKFDEALRVKEAELERQREERRRAQEEEEEREVRELRKRAVPRAHEVPDWYATVPKRSDGGRSTSS